MVTLLLKDGDMSPIQVFGHSLYATLPKMPVTQKSLIINSVKKAITTSIIIGFLFITALLLIFSNNNIDKKADLISTLVLFSIYITYFIYLMYRILTLIKSIKK